MKDKRAQAQSVLAQIDQMNTTLGQAVESYNLANVRLQKIKRDLADNQRQLKVARSNLEVGQQHIAQRVVQLYTQGGDGGTMEVILGAQNLDDLLSRLDTVDRVSSLDTQIVHQVRKFRAATTKHARLLREARTAQQRVVSQRAAKKHSIESQLSRLHRLEASIENILGLRVTVTLVQPKSLARSEGKARRVTDLRNI